MHKTPHVRFRIVDSETTGALECLICNFILMWSFDTMSWATGTVYTEASDKLQLQPTNLGRMLDLTKGVILHCFIQPGNFHSFTTSLLSLW